ncbi:MAG: DegT/DnrJ/EryC1/StrS family aminotransferase, partial [Candidatus Rokubacteria bacterium]|nr:DegT/DnrJ/EryC1/StrS family aminotransferase [Candidatus Rokubacteria bacterium]
SPKRDALAKALADLGVGTSLHYPLPIPGQPLFRNLGGPAQAECPVAWQASREVLSLPCFPELAEAEIDTVAQAVHQAVNRIG